MKLYLKFFSIHVKSEMAYPAAFFMSCLGRLLFSFSSILGIEILMSRFHSVGGHSVGEILLGFGVVMTASNLAECFARGFDAFGKIIRQAQFDRLLVRPKSLIFQVICQDLRLASVTNLIFGAAVIFCGVNAAAIQWTVLKVMVLISMVLCGSLLFFGVLLIYAAMCFYTLEGLEIMNIFTDAVREYSRYPFDVYGKTVLFVTTVIMPMALVQYWPLQYLMDRGPGWYGILPLIPLIFTIPCYGAWKLGLRHYCSSGS